MPPTPQSETDSSKKKIFVISPIGKKDESGFDFSDLVLEEIVKPAALEVPEFGIPERADEVQAPGSITSRIVQAIVDADVCIADLTGRNPNVMYEVAIAHAADKPVILLQQESGGPPFDFASERVLHYGTRADLANAARRRLVEFLRNATQDAENELLARTMHPVRVIFKRLQTSAIATDPQQEMLKQLDAISKSIEKLEPERNATALNEPGFRPFRAEGIRFQGFSEPSDLRFVIDDVRVVVDEPTAAKLSDLIDRKLLSNENFDFIYRLLNKAIAARGKERSDIAANLTRYIDGIPPF